MLLDFEIMSSIKKIIKVYLDASTRPVSDDRRYTYNALWLMLNMFS